MSELIKELGYDPYFLKVSIGISVYGGYDTTQITWMYVIKDRT
jgi:hypothetical protein